jgi:bifunctional non-homologous end joining protein LigD
MLAVPGVLPTRPELYGAEFKWDGARAIAHVRGDDLVVHSRNGNLITSSFPELAVLPRLVNGTAILDGELVALNAAGRPDFGVLQRRLHVARPSPRLLREVPVAYCVFDMLAFGPDDTSRLRYEERRALLDSFARDRLGSTGTGVGDLVGHGVTVPPAFVGIVDDVARVALAHRIEGVVCKRLDSRYEPGHRSRSWIKTKFTTTQEVVIGGWRPGQGRRGGTLGSLLLGIPTVAGLRFVGRVGTGFDDATLRRLMATLTPLERASSPFTEGPAGTWRRDARWVEPRLVGEVAFANWTRDGVLRAPVWRGLRPDKNPADVVVEEQP